jgi:hypothetical protein
MSGSLREVGFFSELRHGHPNGPSLRGSLASDAGPNEERLVAYLAAGQILATTGRLVYDVLVEGSEPIATMAVLTDGEWMWPADLAHYVQHYHVSLPADFIDHLERAGWTPPTLSEQELQAAARAARE